MPSPMAPMVFQCGACYRVISDTNQLLAAVAEVDALVLDAVVGVRIENVGTTNAEQFQLLRCSACDHVVGRVYHRAPQPHLTHMVHSDAAPRYSLIHEALCSYELGSAVAVNGSVSAHETNEPDAAVNAALSSEGGMPTSQELDIPNRLGLLERSVASVNEQLAQVMRVVLALDQRLRSTEAPGHPPINGADRKRTR